MRDRRGEGVTQGSKSMSKKEHRVKEEQLERPWEQIRRVSEIWR
jgi:hypothetical protein